MCESKESLAVTSSQAIGLQLHCIASTDYYDVSDSNEKVFAFVESVRHS